MVHELQSHYAWNPCIIQTLLLSKPKVWKRLISFTLKCLCEFMCTSVHVCVWEVRYWKTLNEVEFCTMANLQLRMRDTVCNCSRHANAAAIISKTRRNLRFVGNLDVVYRKSVGGGESPHFRRKSEVIEYPGSLSLRLFSPHTRAITHRARLVAFNKNVNMAACYEPMTALHRRPPCPQPPAAEGLGRREWGQGGYWLATTPTPPRWIRPRQRYAADPDSANSCQTLPATMPVIYTRVSPSIFVLARCNYCSSYHSNEITSM